MVDAMGSIDNFNEQTRIKVVGVGGAGGNAINRMIDAGLRNVDFVAINTDERDLMRNLAESKLTLSDTSSRGLGAGADPEKGAKAAQNHQTEIEEMVKGADMVFVTCGEGGGTGTGASPIVARAARQQGALTIAVVTRPFNFEGPVRAASAVKGIQALREEVDAIIVIPNDRLLELSDRSIGIVDAFKTADTALLAGVQGITDLITSNSYIHVDFMDVTTILRESGTAMFGIGEGRGEQRATDAAEIAIGSPLLEASIEGASGVLVNIAGPFDLGMQEAADAVQLVRNAVHPEAQVIWGLALDDAYGDQVRVTVIAAGFDDNVAKDSAKSSNQTLDAAATQHAPAADAAQQSQQADRQQEQRAAQQSMGEQQAAAARAATGQFPVTPAQTGQQPAVQPTQQPAQQQEPQYQPYVPNTPVTPVAPTYDPLTGQQGYPNDPGDLDIPDFLR
ncbi:cell division protein FtsZ [Bifidobacterium choloepi]|uniref:Cell division protein FtsZ n=1 Tax=Bifidobacterium choloepi TaxID=2614131 RepID=A0A6I5MZD9_9BIFI|nr:cell division protein FtsZ [Bifidobacterium choloepi]NEG70018.1 cell division protein FtsZ [Bifidobacterium choloepi]